MLSSRTLRYIIGVSKFCVFGSVKRYHQRKSIENAFRIGRPRKTTDRIDRLIVRHAVKTKGQSYLTKIASRGAHSPVRGHPRGSKFVPLNSWGRGSY